jgi:hypothetical protein
MKGLLFVSKDEYYVHKQLVLVTGISKAPCHCGQAHYTIRHIAWGKDVSLNFRCHSSTLLEVQLKQYWKQITQKDLPLYLDLGHIRPSFFNLLKGEPLKPPSAETIQAVERIYNEHKLLQV